MPEMKHLTNENVTSLASYVAAQISNARANRPGMNLVYGVPRGGIPAAYAVCRMLISYGVPSSITDEPSEADFIIDDIIDSGRTSKRYEAQYPQTPFFALVNKLDRPDEFWYEFPWERSATGENKDTFDDNVVRMLQAIGEDPTREGLKDTPARVVKAWHEWFGGYGQDPGKLFKAFADGAERYTNDELVVVSNIPVYSHCEHHLAAIFGHAHIGYIPNGKIIGLSKVARVVRCFAQRLQVQERLTNQIADAFVEHLDPKGVGVILKCRHFCMESRGVNIPGTITTTSALRGAVLLNHDTRQEFLTLSAAAEPK